MITVVSRSLLMQFFLVHCFQGISSPIKIQILLSPPISYPPIKYRSSYYWLYGRRPPLQSRLAQLDRLKIGRAITVSISIRLKGSPPNLAAQKRLYFSLHKGRPSRGKALIIARRYISFVKVT